MQISTIGYNHCHDADFVINRPNGSDNYLFLLLKTPAIFTFHGCDVETQENSFILYKQGTPQYYRALGATFANDWFHFTLNLDELHQIEELNIPMDQVVYLGDLNELSMLMNNICYENYSSNPHKEEIIELYIKLLFYKLSNKIHSTQNMNFNSHYNKMQIIRIKIYNQPYNDWNINSLARELSMSRSCFQHLYKQFFGVSAITDVIQSRVEHAKYLLSTTDVPIKQISEMCGYNNDIHFMRQFKENTGQTPSQYRLQHF